ncbi:MAG: hypothetical protein ACREEC_01010 [Thermoplasmata archaeon]
MGKRLLLGVVAMIAVVAVGGIGFAAYTSSATVYGSASSGNLALAFDYGNPTGGTYANCAVFDLIGNTVHISATDLSPGDSCSVTLGVINNGSLPATSEATSFGFTSGSVCNSLGQMNCIQVTDNLGVQGLNTETGLGGIDNKGIAGGGGLYPGNYKVTVTEPSGSTDQSLTLSYTITFTGSVG